MEDKKRRHSLPMTLAAPPPSPMTFPEPGRPPALPRRPPPPPPRRRSRPSRPTHPGTPSRIGAPPRNRPWRPPATCTPPTAPSSRASRTGRATGPSGRSRRCCGRTCGPFGPTCSCGWATTCTTPAGTWRPSGGGTTRAGPIRPTACTGRWRTPPSPSPGRGTTTTSARATGRAATTDAWPAARPSSSTTCRCRRAIRGTRRRGPTSASGCTPVTCLPGPQVHRRPRAMPMPMASMSSTWMPGRIDLRRGRNAGRRARAPFQRCSVTSSGHGWNRNS
mmetsp:Transcript_27722/g.65041  ORF Transcript_27722/g.65041 Transcript_27722/m.65041 type:complete len:277 (+) Transcript_27722:749-1579(+)